MYTSRQIQNSHSKVIIPVEPQPQPTKRKKGPLTPTRKCRKSIRQTDKRQTNNSIRKMPRRRLHKPGGNYSKKGQIRKIIT